MLARKTHVVDYSVLKSELEAKLGELLERAAEIENTLSDPGNSDWEENALESAGDEVLSRVGDITKKEIEEIRRALSLIESGRYGICRACGKAISTERLEAMPYATKCIQCA